MEEEAFSLRTSTLRAPSSSPLRERVAQPRGQPAQGWCCPRARSPAREPRSEMPSAASWPCVAAVHAPVQAPSKHTYPCTLYQLRRPLLQNVLCAIESTFFSLFYLVLVSKTLMFKFWFIKSIFLLAMLLMHILTMSSLKSFVFFPVPKVPSLPIISTSHLEFDFFKL